MCREARERRGHCLQNPWPSTFFAFKHTDFKITANFDYTGFETHKMESNSDDITNKQHNKQKQKWKSLILILFVKVLQR